MSGMYPDNQEMEILGKKLLYPGVDENGKFTNGDFNDTEKPASFIPAETMNLIIDNLSELIKACGKEPNNNEVAQLVSLITREKTAKSLIQRDENGRAKIETPAENEDIANKQYVDDNSVKRLPVASNDTLGGIKVGGRFYIDKNGMLADIFDSTPVRIGNLVDKKDWSNTKIYDYGNNYLKLESTCIQVNSPGSIGVLYGGTPYALSIDKIYQQYSKGVLGVQVLSDYYSSFFGGHGDECIYTLMYKCIEYPEAGITWN